MVLCITEAFIDLWCFTRAILGQDYTNSLQPQRNDCLGGYYMNSKQPWFCQFHPNAWILFLSLNQTSILHLPLTFEIKELISFEFLSLFQILSETVSQNAGIRERTDLVLYGKCCSQLTTSERLQASVVKGNQIFFRGESFFFLKKGQSYSRLITSFPTLNISQRG